eukprot:GGOE01007088.1.p1 GENE.GGOE01007088.1~~GGOE01007088.1.p1  ORF type:complete len:115 (+),score=13.96 GGOE01007088.1:231-575(+)
MKLLLTQGGNGFASTNLWKAGEKKKYSDGAKDSRVGVSCNCTPKRQTSNQQPVQTAKPLQDISTRHRTGCSQKARKGCCGERESAALQQTGRSLKGGQDPTAVNEPNAVTGSPE